MFLIHITGSQTTVGQVIPAAFLAEISKYSVNFSTYNRDGLPEESRGFIAEAGAVFLISNGVFHWMGVTMDEATRAKVLKFLRDNEAKLPSDGKPDGNNGPNDQDRGPPAAGVVHLEKNDFSKYKFYKKQAKENARDRDFWRNKCGHQTKLYNRARARISALKKNSGGRASITVKNAKFGNVE